MKKTHVNIIIGLVALTGVYNILLALPWHYRIISRFSNLVLESIYLNKTLSVLTGFFMLILANGLNKRIKVAWIISVPVLAISFSVQVHRTNFFHLSTLIGLYVLLGLIYNYKYFCRESDPFTLKLGIKITVLALLFSALYGLAGFWIIKLQHLPNLTVGTGYEKIMDVILNEIPRELSVKSAIIYNFARTVLLVIAFSLLTGLILILKPFLLIQNPTAEDREKVYELVQNFGDNPVSFLTLERDKKYFFSSNGKGVVAYVVQGGVAVAAGDPLCPDEEAYGLLQEFTEHCRSNFLDICFSTVSDKFLAEFKKLGYGVVRYGEEAIFKLDEYSLTGSKTQKVRQAINAANRAGIKIFEYEPLIKRNNELEEQIEEVSKEWLDSKKSGELGFLLGSISLNDPRRRKYFIATSPENRLEAFLVCVPYAGGKGYYLDVTRKRPNAPKGVMEKLVIESFKLLQEKGVEEASLGLAPLANVKAGTEMSLASALLDFIYENMNTFYGFKTLYQYKKKYNPTFWIVRYLTFYPGTFSPKIVIGLLKAQNPNGISDFLLTKLKKLFKKYK